MTTWTVAAVGCADGLAEQVCALSLPAMDAVFSPGEATGTGNHCILSGNSIAGVVDGITSPTWGVIEVLPDDPEADLATVLMNGAATGTCFAAVHTATALDFDLPGALVRAAVRTMGDAIAVTEDRQMDIETVLRELLMNAAVHGNLELQSPVASSLSVREHHAEVARRLKDARYRMRRVRVEVLMDHEAFSVSVCDEGNGYEQAGEADPDGYSGRGRMIIRDLSDALIVNDGGRRSTVVFRHGAKPVATVGRGRRDVLSSIDKVIHNCPVLIVDDEEILVEMTRFQLQDAGFRRIDVAMDGEAAWQKISGDQPPDIVILDHSMPGMTGLELVQRARADARFEELPMVLVSAHEDREFRSDALRFGATNVLTKPVEPDVLIHRVRQLLSSLTMMRELRAYYRRVEQELAQAQRMQEAMMPTDKAMADLSSNNGVDLSARFQMSSELGGDWWGLTDFGDGKFGLYTVDFSGHGVGPAINTFRLHTAMRDMPPPLDGPGSYLTRLNARMCEILPRGQYATMLYGIVDVADRTFTYAASGCPGPIFGRADGSAVEMADSAGVPVGLSRRSTYENRVLDLPEDGFLFLYSDVMLEGEAPDGSMLGDDGLMDLVRRTLVGGRSGGRPLDRLVDAFLVRSELPLTDDLTAIWLQF